MELLKNAFSIIRVRFNNVFQALERNGVCSHFVLSLCTFVRGMEILPLNTRKWGKRGNLVAIKIDHFYYPDVSAAYQKGLRPVIARDRIFPDS